MIKNYMIVALRSLLNNKTLLLLNIPGLAIGMACCTLILLYVQDEMGFDRFHEHADRIYRLSEELHMKGEVRHIAITSYPMGPTLVDDYPEVIAAVRFFRDSNRYIVSHDKKTFYEDRFLFADANIFDVFTFPLVKGNSKTALQAPFSIVITEQMANKYFGLEDPIGQTLTVNKLITFNITGVLKNLPHDAHFQFDFLGSFSTLPDNLFPSNELGWMNHSFYTYLLLEEGSAHELQGKLPVFAETHFAKMSQEVGMRFRPFLQPLTDIHLHSHLEFELGANGDILYIYLFVIIAFFVLVLACINFTNLSIAHAMSRSKEIGIRKVVGATRLQLMYQFFGESILQVLFALFLAALLVELVLPELNFLVQRDLSWEDVGASRVVVLLLSTGLIAGILSGSYPALYLSGFQPSNVLKGVQFAGIKKTHLKKMLVVFQFAISIVLIINTIIVYDQSNYIRNKPLGFKKEHIVVMPFVNKKIMPRYKSALSVFPNILFTSASSSLPGRQMNASYFRLTDKPSAEGLLMNVIRVDPDFIQVFDLEVLEGRPFAEHFSSDRQGAYIFNEAAIRSLDEKPSIGQKIELIFPQEGKFIVVNSGNLVGIIKDFHYQSLHHQVEPLVIMTNTGTGRAQYFSIRIRSDDISDTLRLLKTQWLNVAPNTPFEYFFFDEDYDKLYHSEDRLGKFFGIFSFLAILVASLGLFGLVSFTTQQRLKEIGVRKVLGASFHSLVFLLSKEFAMLVVVAYLVACPVAYSVMNRWIQNFAYRIDLDLLPFVLGGLIPLFIIISTMGCLSWKAARANPVDVLRDE